MTLLNINPYPLNHNFQCHTHIIHLLCHLFSFASFIIIITFIIVIMIVTITIFPSLITTIPSIITNVTSSFHLYPLHHCFCTIISTTIAIRSSLIVVTIAHHCPLLKHTIVIILLMLLNSKSYLRSRGGVKDYNSEDCNMDHKILPKMQIILTHIDTKKITQIKTITSK